MYLEQYNLYCRKPEPEHNERTLLYEPVHELFNNVYVRPAKPQISLRIRAV